ncbi:nucleoside-diphosphate-sugar epimerase [Novosphingobium sp. SG751A]|uniref:SDR family NAD(P)-dependent oxidoreductase n=1 Tax=Novosphingobium sp. SG751A TaxID=2587000 RepID=UPI001555B5E6|nr:SDR family NAD(P)-dependent oxidoreductase [Novosphingobium sp. SG751A]NOW44815.1 nucleoside-diphosphate-sugar epimerase [Novosphingobium sp. SG751A]
MKTMLIFGLGYSARAIARRLAADGWHIEATGSAGTMDFADEDAVRAALERADAVLSSVPPAEEVDPVLARYGADLGGVGWLGYLSSTGVYGDCGGAWVDESAPVGLGRRSARARADAAWLDRGARVLRLPGIYGPKRSAFDRVAQGRAHRVDLPGQIFSRIHVEDIAGAAHAALSAPPGAYNIADDMPAPQNAVIEEACRISGLPLPPLLAAQDVPPASRAFYAENRRVANGKARRVMGWRPVFADYRAGLRAIWEEEGGVI